MDFVCYKIRRTCLFMVFDDGVGDFCLQDWKVPKATDSKHGMCCMKI